MPEYPDYQDLHTAAGVLRVTYEMTTGDMIIAACLMAIFLLILVKEFVKAIWGR